jgi:hypothetical protein
VAINLDILHAEWLCNQIARKGELKKFQPVLEFFIQKAASDPEKSMIPPEMLAEALVAGIKKHFQRSLHFAQQIFVAGTF